jgi:predicted metalloprotease with PDZ domain
MWLALLFAACTLTVPPEALADGSASSATPEPLGDIEQRYTLTLIPEPFPILRVDLDIVGEDDGDTLLELCHDGGWASVRGCQDAVHHVRAWDIDGGALPVEHRPGNTWTVRHDPGAQLRFSYHLQSTRHDLQAQSRGYYRPQVRDDLLFLIGNTALVYPRPEPEGEIDIALRWRGFEDAGWPVASSYGLDPHGATVRMRPDAFRHAAFMAGDIRTHTRTVGERAVHYALHGDWQFEDEAFVDLATGIIAAERDFFGDHDQPSYFVSLLQVGHEQDGASMSGGTGLTDTFSLFLTPGFHLDEGSNRAWRILHLLAHEHFHHWNGGALVLEEPEELGYWFSEGFTDFYTRRLLLRAGLIDLNRYVSDLNEHLVSYHVSPARDEPNARIQADFWNDSDVHDLPYLRGEIVALLADKEIREASAGERSLDELMRELVRRGQEDGWLATTDGLLTAIEAETSEAFVEGTLRPLIEHGGAPDLPQDLLAPCLELELRPIGSFELGFDLSASREAGLAVGVVEDGPAWAAGLREGQDLTGWSVHGGDPTKEVVLTLRAPQGGERELRYLPQGPPIDVPQLVLPAEGAKGCEGVL